jgi:catechol 2,3-dioxygenase-like lactoylglutathione lyase family enzyme
MTVRGIDHVGITVGDLDAALAFYEGLLGIRRIARGEDSSPVVASITGVPGAQVLWADLDLGGGQILELLQYLEPDGTPLDQRPCDPGASHVGLAVDGIDEVWQRLADAGVKVNAPPIDPGGYEAWQGARCAYVSDPDGRTVELIERGVPGQDRRQPGRDRRGPAR